MNIPHLPAADPIHSDPDSADTGLFHSQLRGILLQIFHQLINSLSGHIIHHKNAFTSSVDQHCLTIGILAYGESIFVIMPIRGRRIKERQLAPNRLNGSSAACTIATTSASKEKHASPTLNLFDSAYSPGESMVSSLELVYCVFI